MELVTIGMPVFNDIEFIEESILCILKQTHSNFKLIISDDGATDGSEKISQKYAELDNRIIYIRQPQNIGISRNMQFLLEKAESKYFMWAADDDLWDENFIKELVSLLEKNEDGVVAFSKYVKIDEKREILSTVTNSNYSSKDPYTRLKNFIKHADDGFGYGLFRTEAIRNVNFPTWWWPNQTTPYNNIYPTLCFYLAKGNYYEYSDSALFLNRIKTEVNVNHKLIGKGNAIKETFSYIIRKFNLITFSFREIRRARSFSLALKVYPLLFIHWFVSPSFKQLGLALRSFYKNRLNR